MCARVKFNGRLASPGQIITVVSDVKRGEGKWAGAARSETVEEVWSDWKPVDIPASSFFEHDRGASRAQRRRVLTEGDVPAGMVISGIGNPTTGEVRILTREAEVEEFDRFGHNRLPVLIPARF
ncbi:MAG: hypothetical protein ACXAEN_19290 [Candidatus Thorarchaeota archaeon]|jgi:hypothetical protein